MKKAQIQGMETIMVVIIITIIIIVAIQFGTKQKTIDIQNMAQEIDYLNAQRIAIQISNLEELKCNTDSTISTTCIDKYKILAIQNLTQDDLEIYINYYDQFQNTQITIKTIFPEESTEITIYDYNDTINKTKATTQIPTLIWDPITNTNEFGIIEVSTYT